MKLASLFLLLILIAACSSKSSSPEPAAGIAACAQNSDCLPCGDGCIPAAMAPEAECAQPTHDSCICSNGRCTRS